eukprot:scaffold35877_cov183-Skeletonema_dohrnii-CCMP3373.AAC.1
MVAVLVVDNNIMLLLSRAMCFATRFNIVWARLYIADSYVSSAVDRRRCITTIMSTINTYQLMRRNVHASAPPASLIMIPKIGRFLRDTTKEESSTSQTRYALFRKSKLSNSELALSTAEAEAEYMD